MRKCSIDLVTGFLSAGKSSFINSYLKSIIKYDEIIVIQCEQGKDSIENNKVILKQLHSNEELTEERLLRIIKFYSPSKIIIECNGIGDIVRIIEMISSKNLKQYSRLGFIASLVDCATFNMFFKNIAFIMTQYIKLSNLIVLNKSNLVSNDIVEKNKAILEDLNLNAHIITCNSKNDLSKLFNKNAILKKVLM